MIITLCGSTKFERAYHFWNEKLSLDGNVVLALSVYPATKGDKNWYDAETKAKLDAVHKLKIDASDAIFVIDEWVGSETYTGDSTKSEVAHAVARGKTVYRSSETCGHKDCPHRLTHRPPCPICFESHQ